MSKSLDIPVNGSDNLVRARSEGFLNPSAAAFSTGHAHSASLDLDEAEVAVEDGNRRRERVNTVSGNLSLEDAKRDEMAISPEDLAELHAMHEEYVRAQHQQSRSCMETCCKPGSAESTEQLEKTWGQSGSWHMRGFCPKHKELPHNNRKFQFFPTEDSGIYDAWGVKASNTKGCKGLNDKTMGQDNFSVSRLSSGWEVFCVMDGHGPDGHWPANRAATFLPHILESDSCAAMLKHGQAKAALLHAFSSTENDLILRSMYEAVDLHCSGCTACCVVRHADHFPHSLWVATVGDSRAVLFAPGHGVLKQTTDHTPTLEGEQTRLEQMGCEIRTVEHPDHTETRIFLKDRQYPGLCMSRSLGDLLVKGSGVIPEPVVEQWSCEGFPGAMLLAASDGVWEFMDSKQAVQKILDAVGAGKSHHVAVMDLVEAAKMEWHAHEGPSYCDDVTAVLVQLDAGPAPPATTVQQEAPSRDSGCIAS